MASRLPDNAETAAQIARHQPHQQHGHRHEQHDQSGKSRRLGHETIMLEFHNRHRGHVERRRDQKDHRRQGDHGSHEQVEKHRKRRRHHERQHRVAQHVADSAAEAGDHIFQRVRHRAHAGHHGEEALGMIMIKVTERDQHHAAVKHVQRRVGRIEGKDVRDAEHEPRRADRHHRKQIRDLGQRSGHALEAKREHEQ
jgi:hypothetical protein